MAAILALTNVERTKMLTNEGNVQGIISDAQEGLIEQAGLTSNDRGGREMPVNVLSRNKSLGSAGIVNSFLSFLALNFF